VSTAELSQPFGLIFVGPPGVFAVWLLTPDERLLDREAAERIGQLAIRAGAADYRPFPLEGEQRMWALNRSSAAHGSATFIDDDSVPGLQQFLTNCGGVPLDSHQPLTSN
jgi:hypothetical protein